MKKNFTKQDFYDLLKPNGDCLEWTKSRHKGYGLTKYYDKMERTHRLALILEGINIPKGMVVMHTCDNPPCCNPAHLKVATHAENIADRDTKGRTAPAKGISNNHALLNEEQVLEIRSLYATGAYTQVELGDDYGVTQANISLIIRRHCWDHI